MINFISILKESIDIFIVPNVTIVFLLFAGYIWAVFVRFGVKTRGEVLPLWNKDIRNVLIHISISSILFGTVIGLLILPKRYVILIPTCSLSLPLFFILSFYVILFSNNITRSAKRNLEHQQD